ncbi:hypothetical protein BDV32DRAFT_125794 [Aspergillus pseudonomiae]|uniref:Uncharacterized protein n=1 Tax=Aspergillus pseudonomiae TaxID=1506151 RepID=A0A5N7DLG6_9EURO|nr:uncharacterized protein BDV37DRAFT_30721 [Aspergillus pseudonomiae]KAB8258438.1 hypothetical protein BDV32DRAFT_125794 [Aspergillus pseudonomiae]KAE8407286.1 hypothetical protein BDV37DRAFT_30721 [Aspergillus pseudonomiae]
MECLHGRISYASWRLRVFQRLFLSSSELNGRRTISRRAIDDPNTLDGSQFQHPEYPKEPGQHDDAEFTASETEEPRLSQTLPQSPLMKTVHPNLEKKHKKRAAKPEDLEDLRRNPWAMALASPPRMCSATGTRIPRALLSDWGMLKRPKSDGLWFMPLGLLKDEVAAAAADHRARRAAGGTSLPIPYMDNSIRHLTLRLVDRLPLLKKLNSVLASHVYGTRSPVARLFPYRWKHPHGPFTVREEKQIIWREDMPNFVLSRMRADVVKQLKHACIKYKRLDATNRVWTAIDLNEYSEAAILKELRGVKPFPRMECGAVLVMGTLINSQTGVIESVSQDKATSNTVGTLPEYLMLPHLPSKVPVFELAQLFSEKELEEIWGYDPRFQSPALYFRPNDPITVNAMLALWKLKGFLRHESTCETPDPSDEPQS